MSSTSPVSSEKMDPIGLDLGVGWIGGDRDKCLIHKEATEETIDESQILHRGAELKEGTRIDRYQILGLIGTGGMGAVYKAYDPELDRSIAIKILSVLPQAGETASRPQVRLMREAQALAKLNHQHVVSIFDVGTYEDSVYIAMEYVKGTTLREWLKKSNPTQPEIIRVLTDAGQGLQAAHSEGIVHRDFKPENLIVGENGQIKVLDFGLARAAGHEDPSPTPDEPAYKPDSSSGEKFLSTPVTQFGAKIGTIAYMAPEHFQSQELDEKTDQFSFCVTLFEALYGKRPFSGRTVEELGNNTCAGRIEFPQRHDVPKWIEDTLRTGLSVSKTNRFASLAALLDVLGHDPLEEKRKRRASRNRRLLVTTLLALTIILPVGVWYGLRYRTVQLCKSAEGEFVGVWDGQTKASVKQAFLYTGKSYASGTWKRLQAIIDDYLAEWTRMRSDVCEARLVRSTQSEELFDLRMNCLHKRTRELGALVEIFTKADAAVVQKAIQASTSLTTIDLCADEKSLRAPYPPPKTEQAKAEVAAIREKLAEVEAHKKTGKYKKGLALVHKLEQEARTVGYRPVLAQVLALQGELLYNTGEYQQAETTLATAARVAGQNHDALLAADAMVLLVGVVGYKQARYDAGSAIARDAEVMLDVAGAHETARAMLRNVMGNMYHVHGKAQEALASYHQSLATMEKTYGPKHLNVAKSLHNIGSLLHLKGELSKASDYYRRALSILEKVLGPHHPTIALSYNNLGVVYMDTGQYNKSLQHHQQALAIRDRALRSQHPDVGESFSNLGDLFRTLGEHDKALKHYQKSLAIYEKALGANHPILVWLLSGIGRVLVNKGMYAKALEPLERAIKICQSKTCQKEPHARSLFALSQALANTRGDRRRATKLAKQAQAMYNATPKRYKNELKTVQDWLTKHAKGSVARR